MSDKKIEKFNSHDPRNFRKVNAWVFDLDNTLYQVTQKLLKNIDEHMGAVVANYLNTSREEAYKIQKTYFQKYGLTLRGLMIHHGLDPEQYFKEMKPMDLNEIPPNPALGKAISHLAGRKFIYTNASKKHSKLVLERLGMGNVFEGIFDIKAANYIPKPAIESYELLCKKHNFDSQSAVMIDDIARNLEPAANLGMTTVWKKTDAEWAKNTLEEHYIDHTIGDLFDWVKTISANKPSNC